MTRYSNRELRLAILFMLMVTALYLSVVLAWRQIPAAKEFFGHTLGILGFLLMLMTETLYSIRKRTHSARWGRMAAWLEFHIFTGLAGPFLVLLHSSWKFNGLAGVVTLLTILVVVSGFLGRYIYTAVPRTVDGVEVAANRIAQEINQTQAQIDHWQSNQPDNLRSLASTPDPENFTGSRFVLGRILQNISEYWQWQQRMRHLDPATRQQVKHLQQLLAERRLLRSQIASLAMTRRLLGIWHAVHIPIGMALFTTACIHIAGAVYYATLLR